MEAMIEYEKNYLRVGVIGPVNVSWHPFISLAHLPTDLIVLSLGEDIHIHGI